MKKINKTVTGGLVSALLVAVSLTTLPTTVSAADYDKPVFEFQNKLANQGNAKAQYFLAQMYEQGRGTETNHDLAKHWYEQARLNGYDHQAQGSSAY